MAAPIYDAIPEEPKPRRQWVMWKQITRAGRLTKVPFDTMGYEGDSSDPARWATYGEVVEAYQKGGYDGIGFTFDALKELSPLPEESLLDCVDEALRAGLLVTVEGPPETYRFSHTIVQHAVLQDDDTTAGTCTPRTAVTTASPSLPCSRMAPSKRRMTCVPFT